GGRLLRVSISGPLPTGLEPNQVNSVLGRLGAGEGWLYNAAGEVEPSETRLDGFSAKDGVWESHWSVTQARPSEGSGERGLALVPATGPPPARLVMLLRIPAGPIVTVPAVFADLPLPPREEELPW
ncbi:MAG: hypothetical protein HUU35_20355, partial [Armatimonadetes bacterium]|nr:hypothetical protein [Armatimonadota bacterium]